jgi:hypothetical protein
MNVLGFDALDIANKHFVVFPLEKVNTVYIFVVGEYLVEPLENLHVFLAFDRHRKFQINLFILEPV